MGTIFFTTITNSMVSINLYAVSKPKLTFKDKAQRFLGFGLLKHNENLKGCLQQLFMLCM
jgi:hypothetical protein